MAERRAAGLTGSAYMLLGLTCGHHVLRTGVAPSVTTLCGHCERNEAATPRAPRGAHAISVEEMRRIRDAFLPVED